MFDVERLHLCARPWCFPEEFQARGDARVEIEAPNVDLATEFFPAMGRDQLSQERFEGHAVQRVFRRGGHATTMGFHSLLATGGFKKCNIRTFASARARDIFLGSLAP